MIKSLELSSQQSCFNKAAADEPVFVLRAKDSVAAMTVRHWATMASGVHEKEKISEALKLADAMDEYRENLSRPQVAKEG
jgi:hypothetical protein